MPRSAAVTYPIRAAARMTGLTVDTLRAWERRYGAVTPRRGDRGRRYTATDLDRLRRLAALVTQGHPIGTIAARPDTELSALLKAHAATAPSRSLPGAVASMAPLTEALDRYDLDEIEAVLTRHAAVLTPRELVFSVLLPLLRDLGDRWERGALRPSQEHLVSAIVRSVLGGLLRVTARPAATPRIVFATPSGERHELGLLCAALLAASAGYGVLYLGPDLPAIDIAHAATKGGASVVVVSLTTPGAAAMKEVKALRRLTVGFELWVGGPEARRLLEIAGGPAHHVAGLDELVPKLMRDGR